MRKFKHIKEVDNWEVLTPSGYKPVSKAMLTEPYDEYKLTTVSDKTLHAADDHIVILEDGSECFMRDLESGMRVKCEKVPEIVEHCVPTGLTHDMYDFEVPDGHVYYTDGILSHNTTTSAAYLLHQAITRPNITIAILANKGSTAAEILERIKFAYENLPWFLQVGVKTWNKSYIELGNGSKIITAATSSSSIRGKSINCLAGDTRITLQTDNGEIINTTLQELYSNSNNYGIKRFHNIRTNSNIHEEENFELAQKIHLFNTRSKYFRWYLRLIRRAMQRQSVDGYYENHHIVPVSIGGSHNSGNIVKLTLREHLVCHMLLSRIMADRVNMLKMMTALLFITRRSNYPLSDEMTSTAKKYMSENMSNKIVSEETRQKLSIAQKERWKINKDEIMKSRYESGHYDKVSETLKGQRHWWNYKINKNPGKIAKTAAKHRGMKRSEESRKRMSEAAKGRESNTKGKISITNGKECKFIYDFEPIPDGWRIGGAPSSRKGKISITNGKMNKTHPKDEPIPEGWRRGMTKGLSK